jgi:hypothetical protein
MIDTPDLAVAEIGFAASAPVLVSGAIPLIPGEIEHYGHPRWDPRCKDLRLDLTNETDQGAI